MAACNICYDVGCGPLLNDGAQLPGSSCGTSLLVCAGLSYCHDIVLLREESDRGQTLPKMARNMTQPKVTTSNRELPPTDQLRNHTSNRPTAHRCSFPTNTQDTTIEHSSPQTPHARHRHGQSDRHSEETRLHAHSTCMPQPACIPAACIPAVTQNTSKIPERYNSSNSLPREGSSAAGCLSGSWI